MLEVTLVLICFLLILIPLGDKLLLLHLLLLLVSHFLLKLLVLLLKSGDRIVKLSELSLELECLLLNLLDLCDEVGKPLFEGFDFLLLFDAQCFELLLLFDEIGFLHFHLVLKLLEVSDLLVDIFNLLLFLVDAILDVLGVRLHIPAFEQAAGLILFHDILVGHAPSLTKSSSKHFIYKID